MAKRKRKQDVKSAAKHASSSRTKMNGATWRQRHDNRKNRAVRDKKSAGIAFGSIGGWLVITGELENHWTIYFHSGRIAEWWPQSAKLVFDRDYKSGIHTHTWQQAFRECRSHLTANRMR